eukprot:c12675_g1_i1.p1 GENE.c12675_g1_i1~~c12675_g1_i1.p1  ORF type:complete len:428 (+),score=79.87 c12675_g1_i1:80-1285(+)
MVEDEFDLDLTYITDQIIAMSLPASGLEGQFRNDLDEIAAYLQRRHPGKFKVFNLCIEKCYDATNFEWMANFPFEDHNAPPLEMIPAFCASASSWLKNGTGTDHVVCIHCKAGKSRTGLMVCSLLLHLKLFNTPEDARVFYNARRTTDGRGLVLPSQVRYLHYYANVLEQGLPKPPAREIILVFIQGGLANWRKVELVVSSVDGHLYTTEPVDANRPSPTQFLFRMQGLRVQGDVKLEFRETGLIGSRVLFFTWFHTAYVGDQWTLYRRDLDKFKSFSDVKRNFTVKLEFRGLPNGAEIRSAAPPWEGKLETDDPPGERSLSYANIRSLLPTPPAGPPPDLAEGVGHLEIHSDGDEKHSRSEFDRPSSSARVVGDVDQGAPPQQQQQHSDEEDASQDKHDT